ncbi:MAG: methyl-accepting chemotaxis protein [Gammaproteobacteria bacterium]|nr:methyl-accepting chemotaxis protein [Gammaproteobacteria bacterium]MCF6362066.1 methyl-accepting chemotaxis protein [Gammaproteobacteria bacterium]
MKPLNNLSIRAKIIAGLGLMQLIIAIIAGSALVSLTNTQKSVATIAGDIEPAVLKAGELEHRLDKANSALGFYLLSHEASQRQAYETNLQRVDSLLGEIQALPLVSASTDISSSVKDIARDIARYESYQERMIELAEQPAKNIPALAYAAEHINPLSQQLLQLLSGMIQTEGEEEASVERRQLLMDIEGVRYAWANVMNGLRAYLAFRQGAALQEINLYQSSVDAGLARLQAAEDLLTLDQLDALEQFLPLKEQFATHLDRLIAIHGSDAWRVDAHLIRTEVGPLLETVSSKVEDLVVELDEMAQVMFHGLVDQVNATRTLVATLLLIGLLLGGLITWLIVSTVVKPLNQTLQALKDIVDGEGDLTRRLAVNGSDEIGQLAQGFNKFAGLVHNIIREVAGYTGRLNTSAERLTTVTEETRRGVEQQQQRTDDVVTAVNEMAANGHEVASNAGAAAEAAQNADAAANDGRQVVGKTIDVIGSLAQAVRQAGEVINRLESDSESIGGVLDVIRGIAEQTNLLALNAAIEAARAGEQGRGFAVVADEVRTLASRTQESTAEIQSMIERLQGGAREAVQVMADGSARADESVQQAATAGEALDAISEAVAVINQMNVQIASAAKEQNAVAEEINKSVVAISGITEQTAAGAQQTASAGNELTQLSEQLSSMVRQFKV